MSTVPLLFRALAIAFLMVASVHAVPVLVSTTRSVSAESSNIQGENATETLSDDGMGNFAGLATAAVAGAGGSAVQNSFIGADYFSADGSMTVQAQGTGPMSAGFNTTDVSMLFQVVFTITERHYASYSWFAMTNGWYHDMCFNLASANHGEICDYGTVWLTGIEGSTLLEPDTYTLTVSSNYNTFAFGQGYDYQAVRYNMTFDVYNTPDTAATAGLLGLGLAAIGGVAYRLNRRGQAGARNV